MIHKAQANPKRVVFPGGRARENPARLPRTDRREDRHSDTAGHAERDPERGCRIGSGTRRRDHRRSGETPRREEYVQELYRLRQRRGVTLWAAEELI